jgi:hypothetical protein
MNIKLENAAQRYVRARLVLEEAEQLLERADLDLKSLLPEGDKYITKDGETVSHVKSSTRKTFIADKLRTLLPARIWKAVRIDAVDSKKLNAYIEAGEVSLDSITEGVQMMPVKSSLRVTFPAIKPTESGWRNGGATQRLRR